MVVPYGIEEKAISCYNILMLTQKTQIATILCTALMCMPGTAFGATIEAQDSVAGLGTDIVVNDMQENAQLVVTPPLGSEFIHNLKMEDGAANLHIPGSELEEAGTYTLTLETKEDIIADATLEVLHDTVDLSNSSLQSDREVLVTETGETAEVIVILRDRFGNTIPDRPVKLISSRNSDVIKELALQTDDRGEQQFLVTAIEPGNMTLRAIDLFSGNALDAELTLTASTRTNGRGGAYPATQNTYNVYQPTAQNAGISVGNIAGRALYGQLVPFDVIDGFVIDIPRDMQANTDENLTITAVDRTGRIVEDYTGTVELASTDPNAILPSFGEVTFRGSDLGRKTLVLGLRFSTPGEHILYAQDSRNPNVNGEALLNVKGDIVIEPKQTIAISIPKQDSMVNSIDITIEGNAAPFVNLIVTGGQEDSFGETNASGEFSIPVNLNPNQLDHTLRVRDDSGRNDSGNLRIKLDLESPEIQKFAFTPNDPIEGEDVLVIAEVTDNGNSIQSVILIIDDEETELMPSGGSGSYQALISFQDSKLYQPKLIVTDSAKNSAEIVSTVDVRKLGLPQVQNLTAESKPSGAIIQWDPLAISENPIDGYRLYVGDSPTNFLYALDTDTTVANVAGLKPGKKYFIAVTAFRGEIESEEKSEIVEVIPEGLSLTVTPGNSSLMLEWTTISEDIPLSQFILEYGIDSDTFTEKRMLSGDQTTFALRDLLNDVTYYVKITPVTTTGEILNETAAIGEGTPTSSLGGFNPGPADPIPAGLGSLMQPTDTRPPITGIHSSAPGQPTTGFPSLKWWVLLAGILGAGAWYRHRRLSIRATDKFL